MGETGEGWVQDREGLDCGEGVKGEKKGSSAGGKDCRDEEDDSDRSDGESWSACLGPAASSQARVNAGVCGEAVVGGVSESESDAKEDRLGLGECPAAQPFCERGGRRWGSRVEVEHGVCAPAKPTRPDRAGAAVHSLSVQNTHNHASVRQHHSKEMHADAQNGTPSSAAVWPPRRGCKRFLESALVASS